MSEIITEDDVTRLIEAAILRERRRTILAIKGAEIDLNSGVSGIISEICSNIDSFQPYVLYRQIDTNKYRKIGEYEDPWEARKYVPERSDSGMIILFDKIEDKVIGMIKDGVYGWPNLEALAFRTSMVIGRYSYEY